MTLTKTPLTALSLLVAATATLPAHAQVSTDGAQSVLVTGTRARDRTVLNSAVPVDVLAGDDLRRAAGPDGNLAAALQALLPSFNLPRQSNSSGADHVRAAQLRGLSPDQVLVLVNGKRRHTAAVINIDSKVGKGTNPVDFNAIPLNAVKRVEVLRDGAGAQYGSDAIAGVINVILDDAAQGGEVEASIGTHHTRFEPTNQRITDGRTIDLRAKAGFALGGPGGGGFVRLGAELSSREATNRAGADEIPFFENQTPPNLALQGQRNYRPGEPEVDGLNLWANAALPLGPGSDLYGLATYNRRKSVGAAFFRYPDSSANVPAVYPRGYRPETTGTSQDLQLAAGARGSLGGNVAGAWAYDASLGFGRNDFDYGVRRSLNASLGAASPTRFDLGRFGFDQVSANADFSRTLAVLNGATLALGVEARRERFETRAGDPASYRAGSFPGPFGAQAGPGLQPADEADRSRNVVGAYADLGGDIVRGLYANLALRHDRYSDFGSATTGKVSGRWALTPTAALRAAVSSNFRAPALAQQGASFTITTLADGGALAQVRLLPVDTAIARSLGARPLEAETSRNFSAGFTWQPLRGTSLALDAYRIDIDDRITLSQRFALGNDSFNYYTNAVDTRTRGVDLVLAHTARLGPGELALSLASAWSKTRITGLNAAAGVGLEEINTLTDAAPDERHVLSATWRQAAWSLLARATRHGRTTRVFDFGGGFTPTQTYAARWQFDLEAEWQLARGLSLALGAVNVGDTYPSRSIADISYFGNLPYDVLSPSGFNGAYYSARVRWQF